MRRLPLWAALVGAGASMLSIGVALDVSAADRAPFPVLLDGSGDNDLVADLITFQNTMMEAEQPVDFSLIEYGSRDGRSQLLRGVSDFAVSGAPFTEAELAGRAEDAGEIIEIPIAVSALAIVATTPLAGWQSETIPEGCDPDDPDFDPELCATVVTPYEGPIRLPAENLAADIVGLSYAFDNNNLASWNSPAIVEAFGRTLTVMGRSGQHHVFINRAEGAAQNLYLQQYAKQLGPQAWALVQQDNPEHEWEPVSEVFSPRVFAKNGSGTQIGMLGIYNQDPRTQTRTELWTGNMAAVPHRLVPDLLNDYPNAGIRTVEIQNALGEWVTPTAGSIGAAMAAASTPNAATFNEVTGGYPLTWVTNLYTVAGSLDPSQTNAMAAAIRYLVTDGQDVIVANGGVALSDAQVAAALASADEVVAANCTTEGYRIERGGPSAYEADTPKLQALAALDHCVLEPPPATTTTTTAAPTTTTTIPATTTTIPATTTTVRITVPPTAPPTTRAVASLPPVTSPPTTAAAPTTTSTTVAATTTTEAPPSTTAPPTTTTERPPPRGRALAHLPVELPDDGTTGFKKLGTLMLGAGGFLGVRRRVTLRRPAA